jgi:hypothetical protein
MERPIVHFAFAVFTNATPAPGAREFAQNRQCVSEEDEIHASDVSKRTRMRSKQRSQHGDNSISAKNTGGIL